MIKLLPFSNNWKAYFEDEKAILLNAIKGQPFEQVEHIGATSVLMCKTAGTIDLLLSIPTKLDFFTFKNLLVTKGYTFVEAKSNNAVMFFYRRNAKNQIVCTLRIVEYASRAYNEIKLFKHHLKEKASHVDKYNEFRETLVQQCGDDYNKYNSTKERYIKSILEHFCEIK